MTKEQANVREFHQAMLAAGCSNGADPITPTTPPEEKRILRAKLMLEECIETIRDGLGVDFFHEPSGPTGIGLLEHVSLIVTRNASGGQWAEFQPGDLVKLADGIADLKYVANGTALAAGIDMEPVDEEVHRSNLTKFVDGSFRKDGKYQKGPNYSRPDIASILAAQARTGHPGATAAYTRIVEPV